MTTRSYSLETAWFSFKPTWGKWRYDGTVHGIPLTSDSDVDAPAVVSADITSAATVPTDPLFSSQWHLNNTGQTGGTPGVDVNVMPVWDDYTGNGIVVGLVDSGVEYTHPDLVGQYNTGLDYDAAEGDYDAFAASGENHATTTTGTLAATAGNDLGVVGIAHGVDAAVFRMELGTGTEPQVADNMWQMAGVDVSSNSWSYNGFFYDNFDSTPFQSAGAGIENAVENGRDGLGTVFVFAAGNGGDEGQNVNYHAFQNSPYTIAVGAIDDTGAAAYFSTPGAALLVTAPGVEITTTDRVGSAGYVSGDYVTADGTSYSTPLVAGTAALMLEANPDLGYRDVQEILAYSARADKLTGGIWHTNGADNWNGGGLHVSDDFGFGLVDAHAAVRLAETWQAQSTFDNLVVSSASHAPGLAISDFTTISDSITITPAQALQIDHVGVDVNISHTWIGDLTVSLTSPDGTTSTLVERPGLTSTYPAGTSQTDIDFELTSTQFWGETGAGAWTLRVTDSAGGDVGTLNDWTLKLYGDPVSDDNLYVFTDEYVAGQVPQAPFGGDTGSVEGASTDFIIFDPFAPGSIISDNGGADTINAAAATSDAVIDLTPGVRNTVASGTFAIADGTVIENVYTGDGDDQVTGNDANNWLDGGRGFDTLAGGAGNDILVGGAGDDMLDGGADTDTAWYSGLFSDYDIVVDNALVTVDDLNTADGNDGSDTLSGIEGLQFADIYYALDLGPANQDPIAVDDSGATDEDTPLTVLTSDLLANDGDADGDPLSVSGFTQAAHGGVADNGDGTLTYTPDADFNGADSFTYTVSDGHGGSDSATVGLTVNPVNDDPSAGDDAIATFEQTPVTFAAATLLANDGDVDGDSLTVAGISQGGHGSVADNGNGTFTYSPNVNFSGADTLTYTVSDGHGGSASALIAVDVRALANIAPSAVDDAFAADRGRSVTFSTADILGNDYDLNGDSLVISDIGDPLRGQLFANGDDSFTYLPSRRFIGSESIDYTVSDGHGGSATGTVTFNVGLSNQAPTAVDDVLAAGQDTPLTIVAAADLFANDSDPDGDTLALGAFSQAVHGSVVNNGNGVLTYTPDTGYTGGDSFAYTVADGQGGRDTATVDMTVTATSTNTAPMAADDSATTDEDVPLVITTDDLIGNDGDADGDPLIVTGLTNGAHGSVADNADGSWTYTPNADYFGADSVTYTVSDGQGGSDTAAVAITINPVNDAPIVPDRTFSPREDIPINFNDSNLLSGASDADGDTLTVTGYTQPSHGVVETPGQGNWQYDYRADANYNGPDSFTYTVSDGNGGTATATVFLDVRAVNDDPVAVDDTAPAIDEDTPLVIGSEVLANDSDIDGDTLSIGAVSDGAHGSVADNGDGTFTYTPDADFFGNDSITYTVIDGQGGGATATVALTIDPVNDDPAATGDRITTDENTPTTFSIASLLANDSDVDGDPISFTGFTQASNGSVADNGDGTLTYTPDTDFSGSDSFSYSIADGQGGGGTATVDIHVSYVNNRPVSADDAVSTDEDTPVVIPFADLLANDTDADGQQLEFWWNSRPDHGRLDVDYGSETVTYRPDSNFNGIDSFTYEAFDGYEPGNRATVTLTVNPVNDAPVAVNDTIGTMEDTAAVFTSDVLLGNDGDVDGDELILTSISQGAHGTVADNNDGTFTYAPDPNYFGGDSLSYTISDGHGGSDTGTVAVTVTAINDAPVAADDTLAAREDFTLHIATADLTANDSDPDGDTLSIASLSQGSHGTVADNNDGTFDYTPAANYYGSDSLTYTVTDGQGHSATAAVDITIDPVNDSPTAVDDYFATTPGTPIVINIDRLMDNDWDLEGDEISFSRQSVQSGYSSIVVNGDNTFTITPNDGFQGRDYYVYVIKDSHGAEAQARAFIDVAPNPDNNAPTAVDDDLTTNIDTPLHIVSADLTANDTDADGDALTVMYADQGVNGTIAWNSIDDTMTFTPDAGFTGSAGFRYWTYDGNSGGIDFGQVTVTVNPEPDPITAGDDAVSTNEDTPLVIATADLLANDTDLEGDPLSITGFIQPANGTVVDNGDGTFTYTPDADFNGSDSFIYTVSDGNGNSDTATIAVTIDPVNDAPVAVDDLGAVAEDNWLFLPFDTLLGNDGDVDGDILTITGFSQGAHGTVTDNGDGRLKYDSDDNYNGSDSFTYTVSDGHGGNDTAAVNISISPQNDAPEAVQDMLATNEDTPLDFTVADLLANDYDVDGDPFTFQEIFSPAHSGDITDNGDGTFTYTPDANFFGTDIFAYTIAEDGGWPQSANVYVDVSPVDDPPDAIDDDIEVVINTPTSISTAQLTANDIEYDGDPLTITDVTQGAHGNVSENGDDTFTYTPDTDFSGSDSFTYTISDGNGGNDTATVNITMREPNIAPVANDDSFTTVVNTPLIFNVSELFANDSDANGDELFIDRFLYLPDAHGHVSLVNQDLDFSYTPDDGFTGVDVFNYVVRDNYGGYDTASVTVTVNPVNDAPVAADDAVATDEDVPLVIGANVLANDGDVDGDSLALTGVSQGAHGGVADNGDGTFTYTPDANFNGTDSVNYTVSDGHGGSDTATIAITVSPVNDAPVAVDDSFATDEDTALTIPTDTLIGNDGDVDGDSLSISGFSQGTHGGVADNGDGTVTYTPDGDFNGADSFSYTVSDGHGGSDTATVDLTVNPVNDDPVAAGDSIETIAETPVTFAAADLLANDGDVDGDSLTVTGVSQGAHGGVADNGDGTFTYTPNTNFNGTDSFSYTVSDGQGGSAAALVSVDVRALVNIAPAAVDDVFATDRGRPTTVSAADILGNDYDPDGDSLVISGLGDPARGGLIDNGDDTYTFFPSRRFFGSESIDYTVSDGHGGSDTGTITFNVGLSNEDPTAVDDVLMTGQDTPLTIVAAADLFANDSDPDGDTLELGGFSQAVHGSVANNGDGTLTYAPNAGYAGSDSFTYTVADGEGGRDTATVDMTVNHVSPDSAFYADTAAGNGLVASLKTWSEDGHALQLPIDSDAAAGAGPTGSLRLAGSDLDDILIGNDDGNSLDGGDGNDILIGGGGADTLTGGSGADTLTGGPDGDTFVFDAESLGHGTDVVADFDAGAGDVLDLADLFDDGATPDAGSIGRFLDAATADDGTGVTLRVDSDGGGTTFTDLATFAGTPFSDDDLARMVNDGAIVVH